MVDKKKQGKKNRKKGSDWELLVRHDLEKKGWIVSKWQNQVELSTPNYKIVNGDSLKISVGRLIPAKRKFNPFKKVMSIGTGFPDFIAYKEPYAQTLMGVNFWNLPSEAIDIDPQFLRPFVIIGVEAKGGEKAHNNNKLSKEEKEKCRWLIDNRIFSKILRARKPETAEELMTGEKIIYEEFKNV